MQRVFRSITFDLLRAKTALVSLLVTHLGLFRQVPRRFSAKY